MPHWDESLVDDEVERERLDSRGVLRALATAGAQVRAAVGRRKPASTGWLAGNGRAGCSWQRSGARPSSVRP